MRTSKQALATVNPTSGKVSIEIKPVTTLTRKYCYAYTVGGTRQDNNELDYSRVSENNKWSIVEGYKKPSINTDGLNNIEKVVFLGIDESIARHCLKKLWSMGNHTAYELMTSGTAILDINDIKQEILLVLATNPDSWTVDANDRLLFFDDEIIKNVFGATSKIMYSFVQRHYKKAYVSIDGEDVRADDVCKLATYSNIDDLLCIKGVLTFLKYLPPIQAEYIKLRLNGHTMKECEGIMNLSRQKVRTINEKVKKAWKDYNK